jgi:integrase
MPKTSRHGWRLKDAMAIENRYGKWHYRFQFKGKTYRHDTGLEATERNRRAAKLLERDKRAELRLRSGPKAVIEITFEAAANKFMDWCENVEYRSQQGTRRRHAVSLASAIDFWGPTPVKAIGPTSILDYMEQRLKVHRVKDVTLRNDMNTLQVFWKRFALIRGYAEANPLDGIKKPSDKDAIRIHVLTPAEEKAYFDTAAKNENLYDLGRLMILQGCRPEEILALRQLDIDLERNRLQIRGGKTRAARRSLELTKESAAIFLRRRSNGSPWVFPSDRREGEHLLKLNKSHDQVCIDAGVSFVPYDLRHTFATRMLVDVKQDVATVAALLGHSGLRAVTKYLHPLENTKTEAMRKYERETQEPKPNRRVVMKRKTK